jgi:hypothetical protein
MKTRDKAAVYMCAIIFICAVFAISTTAAGPPLKANACSACHNDYSKIFPKAHPDMGKGEACLTCHAPDPAGKEATKFSTEIHKIHKDGKAKLECSACHAL